MKKNILYKMSGIALYLAAAIAPASYAQKSHDGEVNIVSANVQQKDDQLYIDMELDLRNTHVGSQKEVILTPVLVGENNRAELPDILIYGKKRNKVYKRSMALKKNQPNEREDAYTVLKAKKDLKHTVSYSQNIPHEEWMKNSTLVIEGDLCGCGKWMPLAEQLVSERASYDFIPSLAYIQPEVETVKKRKEDTEVFIDFKVNQFVIQPNLMNNQAELNKLNDAFGMIRNDKNLTVNQIDVIGYASPEGSITGNENLSKKRAEELKRHLSAQAPFPDQVYRIVYGGENWAGLESLVEASDMDNKYEVLSILRNTPDVNSRKNKLKTFDKGKTYTYMLANFYPKLRKTEVSIHYDIRNFTVEEAKEIFKTRPGQLSLNELFQIANSYPKGSNEFTEVFNTAIVLYPENDIAELNAGAAALSANDLAKAQKLLEQTDKSTPEYVNNMGVYYYLSGDLAKAKEFFSRAAANGNETAQKNLAELNKKIEKEKLVL